jgi:hypothetical protein
MPTGELVFPRSYDAWTRQAVAVRQSAVAGASSRQHKGIAEGQLRFEQGRSDLCLDRKTGSSKENPEAANTAAPGFFQDESRLLGYV